MIGHKARFFAVCAAVVAALGLSACAGSDGQQEAAGCSTNKVVWDLPGGGLSGYILADTRVHYDCDALAVGTDGAAIPDGVSDGVWAASAIANVWNAAFVGTEDFDDVAAAGYIPKDVISDKGFGLNRLVQRANFGGVYLGLPFVVDHLSTEKMGDVTETSVCHISGENEVNRIDVFGVPEVGAETWGWKVTTTHHKDGTRQITGIVDDVSACDLVVASRLHSGNNYS